METMGRRERKKLETYRALLQAARRLVAERGLDGVTVEEIADEAGFTARTFFNHFSSKEEAVAAIDPATLVQLADELRARPAGETPAEALRAVLIGGPASAALLERWQLRHDLVGQHPKLLPSELAAMEQIESALTVAMADRTGTDPAHDPEVRMLVAGLLATTRAALNWWSASDRARPLDDVLDKAFDLGALQRLHRP